MTERTLIVFPTAVAMLSGVSVVEVGARNVRIHMQSGHAGWSVRRALFERALIASADNALAFAAARIVDDIQHGRAYP